MTTQKPDPAAASGKAHQTAADLQRIASSTGVYALAAFAQKGVSFLLLPIYTRFLDTAEYGVLELVTAFATVAFICVRMGLPSAINKCYHRDCDTEVERRSVLATAIMVGLPVVSIGAALMWIFAPQLGEVLTADPDSGDLVRLAVVGGLFSNLLGLFTAGLRTKEWAVWFSVVNLTQFVVAISLNILFVVHFGLGIRGVLWGQLVSQAVSIPLAAYCVRRGFSLRFERRLVRPLLGFGLLLVPTALATWIMNLSDRYILRLLTDLSEVAIYGVGYKLGMALQIMVVWPFQLSWPAVSFSISKKEGHRETYATVLTYLVGILALGTVVLSLVSRAVVPILIGEGFQDSYRVVPLVATAYALNGIYFCVSPGLHIRGKTKYLPVLMGIAATLNIVLNFLLIPEFKMMGAAGATVIAFGFLSIVTLAISVVVYQVEYEYARIAKLLFVAGLIYLAATLAPQPENILLATVLSLVGPVVAFPLLLWVVGFFKPGEIAELKTLLEKVRRRDESP